MIRTFAPNVGGVDDPRFAFDSWGLAEAMINARSAFYVSVTPVTEPGADPRDVPYDASARHFCEVLKRAADAGWEIGLHASIGAAKVPGRLAVERERLRALVPNANIAGVRHHYWNLPGDAPWIGWREQLRAGFCYDSSLGLNDHAGPRWGWAWPFRPWNRATGEEVPLLQIPATTMDVVYGDATRPAYAREEALFADLDAVRHAGGVIVPNWHVEQFDPARLNRVRDVLFGALCRLQADAGNAWWATPGEIASWWNARGNDLWSESP
jgi:hypothetical protein